MSRLTDYLKVGLVLVLVWYLALTEKFGKLNADQRFHVLLTPIYSLAAFGVFSAVTIMVQALRIRNCDQAYAELKEEIVEARSELKKKGMKFEWEQPVELYRID